MSGQDLKVILRRIESSAMEDADVLGQIDVASIVRDLIASRYRVAEIEKLRDSMKYHLKFELERVERVMAHVAKLEKAACNWPVYDSKNVTQEQFDAIVWEHKKMQERLGKLGESES